MTPLDRTALSLRREDLVPVLKDRIARRQAVLEERDRRLGKDRVKVYAYLENIALPEIFGFDMNDYLADPALALDTDLRHRIFWLDNSEDDGLPNLDVQATVGMYFDMTLFGQEVRHTPQGVPEFMPHPIAQRPDLSLLTRSEFASTGAMPLLLRKYQAMSELARSWSNGEMKVGFPSFRRGPLDITIQLRGYENFALDTVERPAFVEAFLMHLVGERNRWRVERARFLSQPAPADPTTFIADDWVDVPFVSPGIFRQFVLPAYRRIQENEGRVTGFHTCGVIVPIVADLLSAFPGIRTLDVSGWNDLDTLDRVVDPSVTFFISFINTFTLCGSDDAHRRKLEQVARVRKLRPVLLSAQAIVRLHDTIDEDIARMNRFIRRARETV